MGRGTRLYLTVFLAATLLIGAAELLPRPYRGFAAMDLRTTERAITRDLIVTDRRYAVGSSLPEDDRKIVEFSRQVSGLRGEIAIRSGQTIAVLIVFVGSILFLATNLFPALALRRGTSRRTGKIDVCADQTVQIPETELSKHLARLRPTRRAAIEALSTLPGLVCGYCGRRVRVRNLGSVGRRLLVKRPPPGAKDLGIKLGEGWWHEKAADPACPRCGTQL